MKRPVDFLLVGLAAGLRNKSFVAAKLQRYLGRFSDDAVIGLNDRSGLLRDIYGERLIDSLSPIMPLPEKRLLIKNCKVAVFFWGGADLEDFVYFALATGKPVKIIPVAETRVVNKEHTDQYDVYIGRGTPWGNPFAIGQGGLDREAAIEAYRDYFQRKFVDDPDGNKAIRSLSGKVLGCHCKPLACHGDVIAAYLNSLDNGR